jgi:cytidylate kinase
MNYGMGNLVSAYGLLALNDGETVALIAQETPLTLRNILNRLGETHPEIDTAMDVRPLSRGLRERGLSFRRTRLSLKKSGT